MSGCELRASVPGLVEVEGGARRDDARRRAGALVEACTHLRDEEGFNFLSDIAPADYLGWGGRGVSGYIGTPAGRDLNAPMTQGYQALPQPKPKRFAMNYHLLVGHRRARGACACRPGSTTASRCRASSRSGRPPTGTSARRGT